MTADQADDVDRLLHDWDRKKGGAQFARLFMADPAVAAELDEEAEALMAKAVALDPDRRSPAWREAGPTP